MRLRITTTTQDIIASVTEWDEGEESVVYRINRGGYDTFYECERVGENVLDLARVAVLGWALEALEGAEELED